jgi:hypothetical protein
MRRDCAHLFPLISILLIFSTTLVRAQGTYTAASAAESDVVAIINGPTHTAVNGDVIQIPCSTPTSVVWSSQIIITASITITALGATPNTGTGTFGAGTNCLTIRDEVNVNGGLFYFQPTYAATNNVTTLQNVNIDPYSTSTALYSPVYFIGTATSSGFPECRIDNVTFGHTTLWNEDNNSSNAAWMIDQDDCIGVADHNTLPSGTTAIDLMTGNFSSWLGVGQYGDESWAVADSFGGANNWFNENNSLYITEELNDCEQADTFEDKGGCRVVNRYNQITCANCYEIVAVHGLDTSGRPRSGRHTEAYKNTVSCSIDGGSCQGLCSYRGGTGLCWGNTATAASGSNWNFAINFAVYRNVYNSGPWGYCGGLNAQDPWDTNDNTVYYSGTITTASGLTMTDASKSWTTNQFIPTGAPYTVYDTTQGFMSEVASNTTDTITVRAPISESTWSAFANGDNYEVIGAKICADQGARGQGNYVSGSTPSPSSTLNQALDPVYEWDDTIASLSSQATFQGTDRIIANRDYYTDNWKGGGLSGPTAQTSATVPFNGSTTCNAGSGNYTCGTGFGALANRPTTCSVQVGYFATDTNTLYECMSTNTWTASYSPYTYPHPLASSVPPPAPPTGLDAQVE